MNPGVSAHMETFGVLWTSGEGYKPIVVSISNFSGHKITKIEQ